MAAQYSLNQYIEHTDLRRTITSAEVEKRIAEAREHALFGVCLPPYWIKKARRELGQSPIRLVTVIGFPLGYQLTEVKLAEAEWAIKHGANELDVVLNSSAIANGSWDWVKIELVRLAKLLHEHEVMLKAILETPLLNESQIRKACEVCSTAGVDFIKTATGFEQGSVTPELIRLIRENIPALVGIKAAGGIRSASQAHELIEAGAERIGTSSSLALLS